MQDRYVDLQLINVNKMHMDIQISHVKITKLRDLYVNIFISHDNKLSCMLTYISCTSTHLSRMLTLISSVLHVKIHLWPIFNSFWNLNNFDPIAIFLHVNILMLHVDISTLHVNICISYVDIFWRKTTCTQGQRMTP